MVATRSGSGCADLNCDTVTSGCPSALMRSAARNRRFVIGSVEQRATTSPLAEVRYSGRLTRRRGETCSIMKSAVCSRSSTASRSPPTVTRGTLAVAARPIGFARRSRAASLSGASRPEVTPVDDRAGAWRGMSQFRTVETVRPRSTYEPRSPSSRNGPKTCSFIITQALQLEIPIVVHSNCNMRSSGGLDRLLQFDAA